MRPLLFIPGGNQHSDLTHTMRSVGLGELARGADSRRSEGPAGSGLLIGWLEPGNTQLRYAPEEQTWIPASGRDSATPGRYHVGIWNDSPPTESELRRPDCRKGAWIKLATKESWLITTPGTLERFPVPMPDGSITWAVDEAFNWLTTTLEKRRADGVVATEHDGAESLTVRFDDAADFWFLCDVLQINYRVTPELVAHMRLLGMSQIRAIVAALMGLRLREDSP